jgi:arsenite methyltransferase
MKKPTTSDSSPAFNEYGVDTPQVTGFLLGWGLLLALLAWLLSHRPLQEFTGGFLGGLFLVSGFLFLVVALWMIWTGWKGKLMACRRLLSSLQLRGNEKLLDLGCGRGLVLTEAAKRMPRGHAVGLDNWSQAYLFQNNREKTLFNAKAAGVEKRTEVVTGDMRRMPFPRGRFDAVTAHLALHRIKEREGRLKALQEAARVLKKGGRLALQDFQYNRQTAEDLRKMGFQKVRVSKLLLLTFPPLRRITAVKK